MDDKWFKKQQKRVGVTAEKIGEALGRDRSVVSRIYVGRQRMTFDQAKVFATILEVPLETVMEKAGINDGVHEPLRGPGFAEGDAAPFESEIGTNLKGRQIASLFGGDRPGVDVWRVSSDALVLGGYLPGDFILVDTHAAGRCKAGDVVVAQVYNGQDGSAKTVLRRFEPPVLIAKNTNPDEQGVLFHDNSNVVIRGRVSASWRA